MMTKSPPRKLTILVVGDGAVGKSALTLRFLRDQYVTTSSRGSVKEGVQVLVRPLFPFYLFCLIAPLRFVEQ